MTFGVHSEVGKLRKVMVHRPGLEHTPPHARRTPRSCSSTTCCGSSGPKAEHDAFGEVMRERGVEVFHAERLLAEALVEPGGQGLGLRPRAQRARGRHHGSAAGPGVGRRGRAGPGGGLPDRRDHQGRRRRRTSGWSGSRPTPTSMLLPPLPNFLFQRDPSCWIYDGVTLNPMTKPARKPETMIMEAIYRFHPMFAAEQFPIWLGGADEDWGRAHVEGGDVQPIGNGAVMIGMGERTTPQAVLWIARSLFRGRIGRGQVLAVQLPKSRSYMHLDTVITMCDRDLVTLFPQVVSGARIWTVRPGDDADDLVVEEQLRARCPSSWRAPSASTRCGSSRPAATRFEAEREQWDDGNNVVALEPGVVVAYERNTGTNTRAAQGGHRGDHHRGLRARPRPRRLPLHDLPHRTRRRVLSRGSGDRMRSTCKNRSFLKEIDFEPRRAAPPAAARRGAQAGQVRRHRGQAARRQGDRADLREDLDPHPLAPSRSPPSTRART